jgi:hypothetical protein
MIIFAGEKMSASIQFDADPLVGLWLKRGIGPQGLNAFSWA